jgi:hypothetical protein
VNAKSVAEIIRNRALWNRSMNTPAETIYGASRDLRHSRLGVMACCSFPAPGDLYGSAAANR